jgi:hypothetical protein
MNEYWRPPIFIFVFSIFGTFWVAISALLLPHKVINCSAVAAGYSSPPYAKMPYATITRITVLCI